MTADDNTNRHFYIEFIIERIQAMAAHFIAVLFAGFLIYTATPGSSLFSWHPTLMVIAFTILAFEGILTFSQDSSLLKKAARSLKVRVHWILMLIAACSAVAGFSVIFYNKILNDKLHFVTWHGILGLMTVSYICFQCMAGTGLLYHSLVQKFINLKLGDMKLYHATSGTLMFFLASVTLVTGMFSNWFVKNVTGTSWYMCVFSPLLLALIVTLQVSQQYVARSRPAISS
ncbi:transmembrane reductase CYB561D2-like isoform X1 [Tubulanus polymorphus]|uniref:transmembrane reductase CYB561D2-like isoform X1 n=1 Tax=Tubulanus polymorphus TaxID=672921 RepID=UPI003DA4A46C